MDDSENRNQASWLARYFFTDSSQKAPTELRSGQRRREDAHSALCSSGHLDSMCSSFNACHADTGHFIRVRHTLFSDKRHEINRNFNLMRSAFNLQHKTLKKFGELSNKLQTPCKPAFIVAQGAQILSVELCVCPERKVGPPAPPPSIEFRPWSQYKYRFDAGIRRGDIYLRGTRDAKLCRMLLVPTSWSVSCSGLCRMFLSFSRSKFLNADLNSSKLAKVVQPDTPARDSRQFWVNPALSLKFSSLTCTVTRSAGPEVNDRTHPRHVHLLVVLCVSQLQCGR